MAFNPLRKCKSGNTKKPKTRLLRGGFWLSKTKNPARFLAAHKRHVVIGSFFVRCEVPERSRRAEASTNYFLPSNLSFKSDRAEISPKVVFS
jgi:hypothetical protein